MSSGRPARRSRSAVSRRTDSTVPPKTMKPADAEVERVGDAGGLVAEAAVGGGAKRGEDEPAGIRHGGSGAHGGVTVPRTRAPLAPVAAGTLPGWPCSVR